MRPSELNAGTFDKYPREARGLAVARLNLLRSLPLPLLVSLLREMSDFDWLFPAEQRSLLAQVDGLAGLAEKKRNEVLAKFSQISVPDNLAALDWVNEPKHFLEELTAWLWSSSQLDTFRNAARDFAAAVDADAQAPAIARASVVVLPAELDKPGYTAFRKLCPQGTLYESVTSTPGLVEISEWMEQRAAKDSRPLAHFYIEGGSPLEELRSRAETVSWAQTAGIRAQILKRVAQLTVEPGTGPEMARSKLARLSPSEMGLHAEGREGVMERFALSVMAEGAGTQIFSTTFAQWGAREVLRRAQPSTLVVRFASRRVLQSMNEMLAGDPAPNDMQGSFLDADMGAYYTWLNQQRLAGAEKAGFIALAQGRRQAVVIVPGVPKGALSKEPASLAKLLSSLST